MSLQAEWHYLHISVLAIGALMVSVEEALTSLFLSKLLGEKKINQLIQDLLALSVKHAGMVILDPTTTADNHYLESQGCSEWLVELLLTGGRWPMSNIGPVWDEEVGRAAKIRHTMQSSCWHWSSLDFSPLAKRRLERAMLTVLLLTVVPDLPNGTTIYVEAFWDNLCLHFGLKLLGTQNKCDFCGSSHTV